MHQYGATGIIVIHVGLMVRLDIASGNGDSLMLRILGSESKLCDGLSRRDLLQIGGLGTLGLNVADWFGLQETQAASTGQSRSFGKAKACILVFLTGSPPQHETFDPKPLARPKSRERCRPFPAVCRG